MYTHQKRPYRCLAVQWDGKNIDAVTALLDNVTLFGSRQLIVRSMDERGFARIDTLYIGWWAVQGENGVVKIYNDETFNIKYKPIDLKCKLCDNV